MPSPPFRIDPKDTADISFKKVRDLFEDVYSKMTRVDRVVGIIGETFSNPGASYSPLTNSWAEEHLAADDPHDQYLLADGTRAVTGDLTFDNEKKLILNEDVVNNLALWATDDGHGYLDLTSGNSSPDDSIEIQIGGTAALVIASGIVYTTTDFRSDMTVRANGGFNDNGSAGIDTTFIDNDGNTITVSGGIITAKVAP